MFDLAQIEVLQIPEVVTNTKLSQYHCSSYNSKYCKPYADVNLIIRVGFVEYFLLLVCFLESLHVVCQHLTDNFDFVAL